MNNTNNENKLNIFKKAKDLTSLSATKITEVSADAKQKMVSAIDQNGNGEIDIEDVIILAIKTPGVKVKRAEFIRKELETQCEEWQVTKAIEQNPASAGIDSELIDKLARDTVVFERNCVSGISTALGIPGGYAMIATIPVDIAQYYGYMLRAAQKLMYLYGFPEIDINQDGQILDTSTINSLTVCLGVMYGVAGANKAICAMAKALGEGVSKQLMKKALTKGTIYPIVKSIAKWFNVKMTKEVFSSFFKKAIPIVGGVAGGAITFATFGPCCNKLIETLKDTRLSKPETYIIDADVEEIYNQITEEE